MEQYIQSIPGWDGIVIGMQYGVLLALLTIFSLTVVVHFGISNFLPLLLTKWGGERKVVSKFSSTFQKPLGIAIAAFVLAYWLKELAAQPALDVPPFVSTIAMVAEAVFLVSGLMAAIRAVEMVEYFARWIDDDGELDASQMTLLEAVESTIRFAILITGLILIADSLGFNLGTIVAGLGITGLAVAFAAKDSISNLFGAVTLLMDRPFQMGDWIGVGSIEGEVISIGIRTTLLRTSADTVVTLPNSSLVDSTIENWGKRRWRRYQPVISLDLNSDPDAVETFCRGVEALITNHGKTTKHEGSYARVSTLAKDSIEISCNLYWDVSGGMEERQVREELLLDISKLAKKHDLRFFDPRIRSSM